MLKHFESNPELGFEEFGVRSVPTGRSNLCLCCSFSRQILSFSLIVTKYLTIRNIYFSSHQTYILKRTQLRMYIFISNIKHAQNSIKTDGKHRKSHFKCLQNNLLAKSTEKLPGGFIYTAIKAV